MQSTIQDNVNRITWMMWLKEGSTSKCKDSTWLIFNYNVTCYTVYQK